MADFLGIGYELWAFFSLIFLAVFYTVNKSRVRDIPVEVVWLLKTGAGYLLRAKEDIAGTYIDIYKGRRAKKLTTIGKAGLPIEVTVIPEKAKAYLTMNNGKPGVSYDVHLGGLQRKRLFFTIEGTGETIDILKQNNGGVQNMHQTIINEELGATQGLVRMVKEEVGVPFRTFILTFGAGAGLAASALLTLLVLFGHLR